MFYIEVWISDHWRVIRANHRRRCYAADIALEMEYRLGFPARVTTTSYASWRA